jgi:hypothetical protein
VTAGISQEAVEPGYEFHRWSITKGNITTYDSNSSTSVEMIAGANQSVIATAHYTAINYTLHVEAVNSWGTINTGSPSIPAVPSTYTIEDDPIRIRATTKVATNFHTYQFIGWTYDEAGLIPVTDALGNEVTGMEFFFIPMVPEEHMSDPNRSEDVTIYAQFNEVPRFFNITLNTALNTYTNLNTGVGTAWVVGETAPYSFTYGTQVDIDTEPNPGYRFKHWTNAAGTVHVQVPEFNYTVGNTNVTFIAVYEYIPYELIW